MRRLAVLVPLTLAACVPPAPQIAPAPAPSAAPPPVAEPTRAPIAQPLPAPQPFTQWMDAPATPGDWRYRANGTDRVAEFLSPAGGQIFQMVCNRNREITLAVTASAPNAGAITIRTEHFDRALSANSTANSVSAVLSPADTLLDAMAFSKGRFAVEVAGGPQLFLPAYPEVTRVIEDCRG